MQEEEEEQEAKVCERERGNPRNKKSHGPQSKVEGSKGDRKTCGNTKTRQRVKTPTISHSFVFNTFNWTSTSKIILLAVLVAAN